MKRCAECGYTGRTGFEWKPGVGWVCSGAQAVEEAEIADAVACLDRGPKYPTGTPEVPEPGEAK